MSEVNEALLNIFGERASRTEPKSVTRARVLNEDGTDGPYDGPITARHYEMGSYRISVPTDVDQAALVAHRYHRYSGEKNMLPNLHFSSEGELIIPIEDLVHVILARADPEELAEALWRNDEVRERFQERMTACYAESFTEAERRRFLAQVQGVVHSAALDRVHQQLYKLEDEGRRTTSYERWKKAESILYRRLYEWTTALELTEEQRKQFEFNFTKPEYLDRDLQTRQDPLDLESVGPEWHASRDYWRARLAEVFPGPEIPAAEEKKEDIF